MRFFRFYAVEFFVLQIQIWTDVLTICSARCRCHYGFVDQPCLEFCILTDKSVIIWNDNAIVDSALILWCSNMCLFQNFQMMNIFLITSFKQIIHEKKFICSLSIRAANLLCVSQVLWEDLISSFGYMRASLKRFIYSFSNFCDAVHIPNFTLVFRRYFGSLFRRSLTTATIEFRSHVAAS